MDVDDNPKKRRLEESPPGEDMFSAVTLAPMSKSLLVRNREIIDFTEKRQDGETGDFTIKEHRSEAARITKINQPALVTGGSGRRGSSGDKNRDDVEHAEHIEFLLSMYKEQEKNERYFAIRRQNQEDISKFPEP